MANDKLPPLGGAGDYAAAYGGMSGCFASLLAIADLLNAIPPRIGHDEARMRLLGLARQAADIHRALHGGECE